MECAPSGDPSIVQVRRSGARASRGTDVHKYLDLCMLLGPEEAAKAMTAQGCDRELVQKMRQLDIREVARKMFGEPVSHSTELAMALDVSNIGARVGRILEKKGERDYSDCLAMEIPMTMDLLWETEDARWMVDYKTSAMYGAAELLLKHRWQLTCGALALPPGKAIKVCIVHIDDDMICRRSFRDISEEELQKDYEAMHLRALELPHATAHTPGDHCRYCPKYDACPATTGLLRELVTTGGETAITGMTAVEAYHKVKQLKTLADSLDSRMKDHARLHPIDLGNGKVYGPVEMTRSTVDPTNPEARAIIMDAGAGKAFVYEARVTADSLTAAVGRAKQKEIMAKLKEAGALRVSSWTQLKEHKE